MAALPLQTCPQAAGHAVLAAVRVGASLAATRRLRPDAHVVAAAVHAAKAVVGAGAIRPPIACVRHGLVLGHMPTPSWTLQYAAHPPLAALMAGAMRIACLSLVWNCIWGKKSV